MRRRNDERKWKHEDQVPAAACRLAIGAFELQAEDDNEDGGVPVRMVARSGKPINHWYWGRVVHDLAGMHHKDSIAIDWCHTDELMGVADQFDTSSGELEVAGRIIPYQENDRASEVIFKGQRRVPYEASIFFGGDGLVIEEVGNGAKAEVNGYELDGPAVIFREWPLRAVACCPYGQDQNTRTELAAGDEMVSVTVLRQKEEQTVSDDPTKLAQEEVGFLKKLASAVASAFGRSKPEGHNPPPVEDVAKPDPTPTPDRAALEAQVRQRVEAELEEKAKAKREMFTKAFGDEPGLAYLAQGLTFHEAAEAHSKALAAENEALKTKLAAVDRGDDEEAEFGSADSDGFTPTQEQAENHGGLAGLVAFNAAKLPSRN